MAARLDIPGHADQAFRGQADHDFKRFSPN